MEQASPLQRSLRQAEWISTWKRVCYRAQARFKPVDWIFLNAASDFRFEQAGRRTAPVLRRRGYLRAQFCGGVPRPSRVIEYAARQSHQIGTAFGHDGFG